MRRHIDGAYVAAQIRLVRQVHKGSILILEGETDAKAFDRFIDPSSCAVEIAFGKENALFPYQAKAGCPTIRGRRRTREAPVGMAPALSWS